MVLQTITNGCSFYGYYAHNKHSLYIDWNGVRFIPGPPYIIPIIDFDIVTNYDIHGTLIQFDNLNQINNPHPADPINYTNHNNNQHKILCRSCNSYHYENHIKIFNQIINNNSQHKITCDKCNYIAYENHSGQWYFNDAGHSRSCYKCGYVLHSFESHQLVYYPQFGFYICSVCGYTTGNIQPWKLILME